MRTIRNQFYLIVSFTVSFFWFLYFATDYITPGSSAVATAAFNFGGILNPPGYPLFGIFSTIFKYLPIKSLAYKANIMSCFCGGISSVFIFLISNKLISNLNRGFNIKLKNIFALFSVLLWISSPLAISHFSHIEKYSVSILFFLLFTFYVLKIWFQNNFSSKQFTLIITFFIWSLIAHYAYSLYALFCLALLTIKYYQKINWKFFYYSVIGIALGLSPILYFPIASLQNPILDWWNPENIDNILQVLFRSQYQNSNIPLTQEYLLSRIHWQYQLAWNQWPIQPMLITIFLIPYLLFKRIGFLKYLGLFGVISFLVGDCVTIFLRIFDPLHSIPSLLLGFQRYMWSFYLAWVLILIFFFVIISTQFLSWYQNSKFTIPIVLVSILIILVPAVNQRIKVGKYPAVLPEWVQNIKVLVKPDSVILTSFDASYFALLVAQQEGKFPKDIPILHDSLLRMPWFYQTLSILYPSWYQKYKSSFEGMALANAQFFSSSSKDQQKLEHWLYTFSNLISNIHQNTNHLFVIANNNLMPMSEFATSRFNTQPYIIGNWAYKYSDEISEIPWEKLSFSETFKGSLEEFPWLMAFREAIRYDWIKRKPIEENLFSENKSFFKKFEKEIHFN